MSTDAHPGATEGRLQRNAIGLAPVLFQSITHMAPAAAVAFSIIFAVTYAGGATPLAVLLALVACLFVAISIGQLARHLPSAGGLYTYSARGASPDGGLLRRLGLHAGRADRRPVALPDLRQRDLGIPERATSDTPTWLWAPFAALARASECGRSSTAAYGSRPRPASILGAFEIVVFLALAITLIVAAGSNNTLSVFNPNTGNAHGLGLGVRRHGLHRAGLHRLRSVGSRSPRRRRTRGGPSPARSFCPAC